MHRLAKLRVGSLFADILKNNIQDAEQNPLVTNCFGGIGKQTANLVMASPFSGGVFRNVGSSERYLPRVCQDLRMSPRIGPSAHAKLCTHFCWFARPVKVSVEPYYELPVSITKLRILS